MLNLNAQAQALADNRIDINGVNIGTLTDDEARRIIDVIHGMINARGNVSVNTPVNVPTPAPVAPTVYDHVDADFTDIAWHVADNRVTYTHKDGKYLHEKAVRNALNATLKASGATYDADAKAWTFVKGNKRDLKGATDFVASAPTIVTADAINQVRDKWTEKSAKRANKQ